VTVTTTRHPSAVAETTAPTRGLSDDGTGMPATAAKGRGSGLRLIEQLADQADATLTWDQAAGTRAELVFPV